MARSSFYTRSNTRTRRGTALLVPLVAALVLPLLLGTNFLAAAADLVIANVEECLDCTEADCWYCESEHRFTDTGKHFSMCECDRSDQPRGGYCGTIYGEFNRYANSERLCIVPPTTTTTTTTNDFQHDGRGAAAGTGGDSTAYAKTIVILIALLPVCCCLGICCGCGMYYYLAKLQREVEEERRLHECKTAMMKVVTARDLSSSITKSGPHASSSAGFSYIVDTSNSTGDYSSSSSSTDEEEQQRVPQHHVIT
jgi:hypothetical protein